MKKLLTLAFAIVLVGAGCQKNLAGGFNTQQANNTLTVSSTPVGADGNIQFATGGLFNSSNNLNWDNATSVLKATGDFESTTSTKGLILIDSSGNCHRFAVAVGSAITAPTTTCP